MNSLFIAIHFFKKLIGTKKSALVLLLFPSLLISAVVLLNVKDSNDKTYRIDYVNLDEGVFGDELIQVLERLPNMELRETKSADLLRSKVVNQKTNAAFIIPAGFSQKIAKGDKGKVTFIQLGRNAVNFSVQFAVEQMIAEWTASMNALALQGTQPGKETWLIQAIRNQVIETKLEGEGLSINPKPKLREVDGLMLLFIMGIVSNAVVQVMEEQKNGTLRRMFAAPIRSWEIVAGNFLGVILVGTIQILLVLGITRWVSGFGFGLPFWSHFVILLLFLFASVGMASATIRLFTDSQHLFFIQLLIIIPTCMIGGCFWSVDDMPELMRKISNFVPQSWAIDALQQLKDGANLRELLYHEGILIVFAMVMLSFGASIFQPSKSS